MASLLLLYPASSAPVSMSLSPGRSCARSRHSSSPSSGDASPLGGTLKLFALLILSSIKNTVSQGPGLKAEDLPAKRVEMVPNQVMCEMVSDEGGHFIPAGIFGLHTLSLLLASLIAHDRAKEDTRTHTGKEHKFTNTRDTCTLNVGTVYKPRQGGINSVPL